MHCCLERDTKQPIEGWRKRRRKWFGRTGRWISARQAEVTGMTWDWASERVNEGAREKRPARFDSKHGAKRRNRRLVEEVALFKSDRKQTEEEKEREREKMAMINEEQYKETPVGQTASSNQGRGQRSSVELLMVNLCFQICFKSSRRICIQTVKHRDSNSICNRCIRFIPRSVANHLDMQQQRIEAVRNVKIKQKAGLMKSNWSSIEIN